MRHIFRGSSGFTARHSPCIRQITEATAYVGELDPVALYMLLQACPNVDRREAYKPMKDMHKVRLVGC